MRVLVAIAHHGSKNRPFLEQMVATFRDMDHDVDVVVLVEADKPLPAGVEARVGVPGPDPWSLPFAHRGLFAERRDSYDLFVYSEDDTLITQDNLDTFLELSAVLPDDCLSGFMRYELFPDGSRSYCSVHSHYRWDPDSTFHAGGLAFGRFTNDHGACYAVTADQLARAIESGGFLVPPHAGEYDMLVSAATDVYAQCGFTKVTCLDRREGQLVHHLPNVYLGQLGVSAEAFDAMWSSMDDIAAGSRTADQLVEPTLPTRDKRWARHCYADAAPDALDELLPRPSRVLAVGTTGGLIERRLVDAGHDVRAVPVDHVLGAMARAVSGATVLDPVVVGGATDERVDAVLALDVLQYLRDPVDTLGNLSLRLRRGGRLIGTVPNHRRHDLRHLLLRGSGPSPTPADIERDGLHWTDADVVRGWFDRAGFVDVTVTPRRASATSVLERARARDVAIGNILLVQGRCPET